MRGAAPGGGRDLLSLFYDPKIRGIVFQAALLLFVVTFGAWIIGNAFDNLAAQNKRTGFGFLWEKADFQILTTPGTWLLSYEPGVSTNWSVFFVGVVNTLTVSFLGIIAATIIGFILGVFRLSSNIVLRGVATVYIEVLRNVPLLLQLYIWYKVLGEFYPGRRDEPWTLFGGSVTMEISGLRAPAPIFGDGMTIVFIALVLSIVGAYGVARWARMRREATGQPFPTLWVCAVLIVFVPLLVFWAMGSPIDWEYPKQTRFGFRDGYGFVMKPEMFAIWIGLSLYTAAFIAEIVRAGVLAVHKGQTEAASALGMRPQTTLSLIVIPQAMRVIVPPLTSQYLNLTKNSSLATAIAFTDVYALMGTVNQKVGQEVEVILMIMAVYLTFSLLISLFMNFYNRRIALVER